MQHIEQDQMVNKKRERKRESEHAFTNGMRLVLIFGFKFFFPARSAHFERFVFSNRMDLSSADFVLANYRNL